MTPERLADLAEHRAAWDDAEIKRMLGAWVSELEPELIYHAGHLVGLTQAGIPIGVRAPVLIRARHYSSPVHLVLPSF